MSESYESSSRDRIEQLILSASRYVRPSSDLRPRTLEAARRSFADQRAEQTLGGFVLAVLLLAFLSSPALAYVDVLRSRSTVTSADEIQNQAIEYSKQPEIGSHWGLTEAFTQLRRAQANRMGMSFRSIE